MIMDLFYTQNSAFLYTCLPYFKVIKTEKKVLSQQDSLETAQPLPK